MKSALSLVVAAIALCSAGSAMSQNCDLSNIDHARELHEALSARAIEVVERAALDGWARDERLARLVAPSATFSLGTGDVNRPYEPGVTGAHALAADMQSTSYRYLGWDYMNRPAVACDTQKVTIEFTDAATRTTAQIEFTFEAGRVVSATGWQRTFATGALSGISP